jgi:hypothetical protein
MTEVFFHFDKILIDIWKTDDLLYMFNNDKQMCIHCNLFSPSIFHAD